MQVCLQICCVWTKGDGLCSQLSVRWGLRLPETHSVRRYLRRVYKANLWIRTVKRGAVRIQNKTFLYALLNLKQKSWVKLTLIRIALDFSVVV